MEIDKNYYTKKKNYKVDFSNRDYLSNANYSIKDNRINKFDIYSNLNNDIDYNKYMGNSPNQLNSYKKRFSGPANKNSENNDIVKIKERLDFLQNKLNYMKTMSTKNQSIDMNRNNNIINSNYNINKPMYYNFDEKGNYINYKANLDFKKSINNNLKLKDLNEIHNSMKINNPNSSLIKRITSYRTTHPYTNNLYINYYRYKSKSISNNNPIVGNSMNNKKLNYNQNFNNNNNITNNIGKEYINKENNSKKFRKINNYKNNILKRNQIDFKEGKYNLNKDKTNFYEKRQLGDKNENINKISNISFLNNKKINNSANTKSNIYNLNNKQKKLINNNSYYININNIINKNNSHGKIGQYQFKEDNSENLSDIAEEIIEAFHPYNTFENEKKERSYFNQKIKINNKITNKNIIHKFYYNNPTYYLQNQVITPQKVSNTKQLIKETNEGNRKQFMTPMGKNYTKKEIYDYQKNDNKRNIPLKKINLNKEIFYLSNGLKKNQTFNREEFQLKNKYLDNNGIRIFNSDKKFNYITENNNNYKKINNATKIINNVNRNKNFNINSNVSFNNNYIQKSDLKRNLKNENKNLIEKKEFPSIDNVNIMNSLIIINKNEEEDEKMNKIKKIKSLKENYLKQNNMSDKLIQNEKEIESNPNYHKNVDLDQKANIPKKYINEEINKIIHDSSNQNQDSLIKKIIKKREIKEKEKIKENKHIKIHLENNLYYYYKENSTIFDYYEIYNIKKEQLPLEENQMDLNIYMKNIKNVKNLLPCLKKYKKEEIKKNEEYKDAENLSEKDIIPDLYKEEDEDIKSLEKSLESSIDKSFDKNYEKMLMQYYHENRFCNVSLNDLSSNSNNNGSNKGKNAIKNFNEKYIEEVDEENEENEKEDKKINEYIWKKQLNNGIKI